MATSAPNLRLGYLSADSFRSRNDWNQKLNPVAVEELRQIGALEEVEPSEFISQTISFDFGDGALGYEIFNLDGITKAFPSDGGTPIEIKKGDIYKANPKALFQKIAEVNRFQLQAQAPGQSSQVMVAERLFGRDQKFSLLMILDPLWFSTFGAQDFLNIIARSSSALTILFDGDVPMSSGLTSENTVIRKLPMPTAQGDWIVNRDWYSHPRFGLPAKTIIAEHADKKIVFDGLNKKIYLLGEVVRVEADSRPFHFLRGLCHLALNGNSAMALEVFAEHFLGLTAYGAAAAASNARKQAKEAIKATFTDEAMRETAFNLCMPNNTPRKTIKTGFVRKEVYFVGS